MEKKINKKNIKRYAATGLLAASIVAGIAVNDGNIDHTKEVCPITRIMNVMPNPSFLIWNTYLPTGVALHQWPEMDWDYEAKGIEDVQITYGKITEKVEEIQIVMPNAEKNEDGSTIYTAPSGFCFTNDENGNLVCQRTIVSTQDAGYGLMASWGELIYDNDSGLSFEYEETLKIRK